MNVLVLNCGSSSIKYQLLDMAGEPTLLAKGLVEKIGSPPSNINYLTWQENRRYSRKD